MTAATSPLSELRSIIVALLVAARPLTALPAAAQAGLGAKNTIGDDLRLLVRYIRAGADPDRRAVAQAPASRGRARQPRAAGARAPSQARTAGRSPSARYGPRCVAAIFAGVSDGPASVAVEW